jgi:hypothetical protein
MRITHMYKVFYGRYPESRPLDIVHGGIGSSLMVSHSMPGDVFLRDFNPRNRGEPSLKIE